MAKNVTVRVSDELASKMKEFTEVNWSDVARKCFEQYIKKRLKEKQNEVKL